MATINTNKHPILIQDIYDIKCKLTYHKITTINNEKFICSSFDHPDDFHMLRSAMLINNYLVHKNSLDTDVD